MIIGNEMMLFIQKKKHIIYSSGTYNEKEENSLKIVINTF